MDENQTPEEQLPDEQTIEEQTPDMEVVQMQPETPPEANDETEPVPMSPEKRSMLLILIAASLLLFVAGGYWLFFAGKKATPVRTRVPVESQTPKVVDESIGSPSSEPTETTKVCENVDLKLAFSIPVPWNCEVSENTLQVSGSIFTIQIGSDERGTYCINDPETNTSCQETPFLSNRKVDLMMYKDQNGGEIFGTVKIAPPDANGIKPWMAITYGDIAARTMTDEETSQLLSLVNSIHVRE